MFKLTRPATAEREIKKSRFATIAAPIADEAAAKAFIAENSFADASHNCWAWRIGADYRFSDDGEPGGTAGKPILQAIEGQEVDNVVVVVSRWFGGVKLGTGGLARAYGGSAAECLREAEKEEIIPTTMLSVAIAFTDLALVESRLEAYDDIVTAARDFDAQGAVFRLVVPDTRLVPLAELLRDLTNGRAALDPDILADPSLSA
ncbi:IMPACT family protein [Martelella radicis]|uniref:Putative YigZ family protein n=1 Tax=Martelella radicis TaxID=1397476 RepID=A0A7W6P9H2_9HYPH|nr:YigZ family protein [Martelella radicis]MBB4120387.1 putative YigZ family protein [Martelella radicis]